MAGHLKEYGWEYVCCDIQWSEPTAGEGQPLLRALRLADLGRVRPPAARCGVPPSAGGGKGFGPIAEKIHNMGLKFGIHIMRGVPRLAVHQHLPVKGADTTCDKIASDASICRWNTDMYGIDARRRRGPRPTMTPSLSCTPAGRGLREGGRHLQHQRLPQRPLLWGKGNRDDPQGH